MRVRFTSIAASISLVICFVLGGSKAAVYTAVDPQELYGDEIAFDVYRENARVGSHVVRFNRTEDELLVNSRFELTIDVLFFTVYRFLYESKATWRSGTVDRINVEVDDNGEMFRFEARRNGHVLTIHTGSGRNDVDGRLFPTNHWNAAVLDANRVLNTLTGEVNKVQIVSRGRYLIPTEQGEIIATKYAYSGEFETEVWYDDKGRWVKMRFDGKDGVPIDYICRRCQGPQTESPPK